MSARRTEEVLTMPTVDHDEVRAAFAGGADAIVRITADFGDSAWRRPACGSWSAADVARHVRCVIGWYHDWLDAAEAGRPSVPFPMDDMDAHTATALDDLGPIPPAEAIAVFRREVDRYLERLDRGSWNRRYGYPGGIVAAGEHAALGAVEWHVHAWDLSTAAGGARHEPEDPAALFRNASVAFAATSGRVMQIALGLLAPVGARLRPWPTLLQRAGRG